MTSASECNDTLPSAPKVVRSGDYYLFETDSEEEEEEEEKKEDETPKKSAFQVIQVVACFTDILIHLSHSSIDFKITCFYYW